MAAAVGLPTHAARAEPRSAMVHSFIHRVRALALMARGGRTGALPASPRSLRKRRQPNPALRERGPRLGLPAAFPAPRHPLRCRRWLLSPHGHERPGVSLFFTSRPLTPGRSVVALPTRRVALRGSLVRGSLAPAPGPRLPIPRPPAPGSRLPAPAAGSRLPAPLPEASLASAAVFISLQPVPSVSSRDAAAPNRPNWLPGSLLPLARRCRRPHIGFSNWVLFKTRRHWHQDLQFGTRKNEKK